MAFLHNDTTAAQAGFVKVPGLTKCFTHPNWPGFLCRTVSSMKELVSTGGFMQTHPNGEIMASGGFVPGALLNLGLILGPHIMRSHLTAKKHGYGTGTEDRPHFWDEVLVHSKGRTISVFNSYYDDTSSIGLMAVVTRAEGFIWRLNSAPDPNGFSLEIDLYTPSGAKVPYRSPITYAIYDLPPIGGTFFLQANIKKDDLFPKLKSKIMAGIVSDEAKVIELYSQAYDLVAARDEFKTGDTMQPIRLWPVPHDGKVHFVVDYPYVQAPFKAPYGQTITDNPAIGHGSEQLQTRVIMPLMHSIDDDPVWQGGSQWSRPWVTGSNAYLPVTCAIFRNHGPWSVDGAGTANTPPAITGSFPLSQIPFNKVEATTDGQLLDAADVFCGFTPVVDRSAEGSYSSKFSLVKSTEAEIAAVDAATTGRSFNVQIGTDGPSTAKMYTEISSSRDQERLRRIAVDAASEDVGPLAQLVLKFVNRWDEKVDELVGNEEQLF